MNRAISRLALVATLAFPTVVHAEEDSEAGQVKSDETIVVTATRTRLPASALPLTVDVIGSEQLEDQLAVSGSTVDAVSALLPSFSPTREKLSGSGESLRGRSALFAINGIPQSTPVRDGSRDGYTIDPFFIDRIEVIYGSNALQGIGATGGVVNQVTVGAPREDGVAVRTLLQGTATSGFEGEALGGKAAALVGWRSGDLDLSLGGSFERRGAFLDGHGKRISVDGTQGEIQDSDSWSVFARLGYQISDSARFEVIANRFELEGNNHYIAVNGDRAAGVPATSIRGVTPGDAPSNRAELLSASLTDDNLGGGTFTLQGFFSRTDDVFGGGVFSTFQDPAIDPSGNLFDQSANRSRKLGGKISYERSLPGFDDLTLTAGLDLLFDRTAQRLVQTDRVWVPETDFSSIAPFAQANLALFDDVLRFAGGIRYENVKLDVGDFTTLAAYGGNLVSGGSPSFDKLLWNGGVIVEPVDGVRAYGSYAEGYTIADVGRILRGITAANVDIDNFLALEPVISNNREIGVEVKRDILNASVNYFWSSSDLGSVLVRGLDGIYSVSRQPIEIEGLEITANVEIPPVPGLSIGVGYSDIAGQTDTADADTLVNNDLDGANISPDRLNLSAGYSNGPLNFRLASRHYLARTFNDASTDTDFEGYALIDAFISYATDFGEFSLAAQNLTDKFYVSYDSDTVQTSSDTRYYAGRGRVVTLGWRGSF